MARTYTVQSFVSCDAVDEGALQEVPADTLKDAKATAVRWCRYGNADGAVGYVRVRVNGQNVWDMVA
jgi:hypothetical protein